MLLEETHYNYFDKTQIECIAEDPIPVRLIASLDLDTHTKAFIKGSNPCKGVPMDQAGAAVEGKPGGFSDQTFISGEFLNKPSGSFRISDICSVNIFSGCIDHIGLGKKHMGR